MALDGIVLSNILWELKQNILGGKIDKIYQPESEEIVILIRHKGQPFRLLLTAHPNHPRIHLTTQSKDNPLSAPMFCMFLRKHLIGYRIVDIVQPSFERIIKVIVEGFNELGDLCSKELIIEIMGRHSNVILIDENKKILDSIKRVTQEVSSVRQILPGYIYSLPPSQDKQNPLEVRADACFTFIDKKPNLPIQKAIYQTYSGISPMVATEICFRAKVDGTILVSQLDAQQKQQLTHHFMMIMAQVQSNQFQPHLIQEDNGKMFEFSSILMTQFVDKQITHLQNISETIEIFYSKRDLQTRLQQKTVDLKKNIQTNLERCFKKKNLQLQQLQDIKNREQWRIEGELLTANIYQIIPGSSSVTLLNYYEETQPEITIALDPTLTPAQNAQSYFSKYNKAKRTFIALTSQLKQVDDEIKYLETILNAIQSATHENDIEQIREELQEEGYAKRKIKNNKKKKSVKGKPLRFLSSDGFEIWVGKNNYQNDELTMKTAHTTDLWFHTKDIPGSHVIIKTRQQEVPNKTVLEASHIAAYYSKARDSSNVPVDYTLCKYVKKPNGAKPGFVIYDHNKTVYVTPEESLIEQLMVNK